MKRDKKWWRGLTKEERSKLVALEASVYNSYSSSLISEDCMCCGFCDTPHAGIGLCPQCENRLSELLNKANTKSLKYRRKKICQKNGIKNIKN